MKYLTIVNRINIFIHYKEFNAFNGACEKRHISSEETLDGSRLTGDRKRAKGSYRKRHLSILQPSTFSNCFLASVTQTP